MLVSAGGASAAHNGNNRAELGPGTDANASGVAIVNYSEGRGAFNGSVTVSGLEPGASYTFVVRLGANEVTDQTICSGTADTAGTFTCNAQHVTLSGFSVAVLEDALGGDVATGTFARRGNCRDPQQGGSQCDAPGQDG
jgi:hypothetical protein